MNSFDVMNFFKLFDQAVDSSHIVTNVNDADGSVTVNWWWDLDLESGLPIDPVKCKATAKFKLAQDGKSVEFEPIYGHTIEDGETKNFELDLFAFNRILENEVYSFEMC